MKKTYLVPIECRMAGYQAVDANSYAEAVAFVLKHEKNLIIPEHVLPIGGSMIVKGENKVGRNIEALITHHENEGISVLPKDTAGSRTMFTDTIVKL